VTYESARRKGRERERRRGTNKKEEQEHLVTSDTATAPAQEWTDSLLPLCEILWKPILLKPLDGHGPAPLEIIDGLVLQIPLRCFDIEGPEGREGWLRRVREGGEGWRSGEERYLLMTSILTANGLSLR
jgi:hypothetical protein